MCRIAPCLVCPILICYQVEDAVESHDLPLIFRPSAHQVKNGTLIDESLRVDDVRQGSE